MNEQICDCALSTRDQLTNNCPLKGRFTITRPSPTRDFDSGLNSHVRANRLPLAFIVTSFVEQAGRGKGSGTGILGPEETGFAVKPRLPTEDAITSERGSAEMITL